MRITEALEAESYISKEKHKISKHWESLSLNKEALHWFYNNQSASGTFHDQVLLVKVPKGATGHEGIAHGGFMAALLDEALCFGAFPILPHQVGVTASLSVDYLLPTPAGSWVAVHSQATCREGSRRADVTASVYTIDPELTELPWISNTKPSLTAKQVVVEPKWYEKLTHKVE